MQYTVKEMNRLHLLLLTSILLAPGMAYSEGGHHLSHAPFHISSLIADTRIHGDDNYQTLGIDIEYRISQLTGLGFVFEHAFGELDATTVLAVADIHIRNDFILQIGPGYEWVDDETVFVSRVGFIYEYTFGGFTVAPQLHWDWHDGHEDAVVAGIALGFGF